jgi:hypothetical protein
MSENAKTGLFIALAVVLVGLAAATRPAPVSTDVNNDVGSQFFPEFNDELKAASLEIIQYDEDAGQLRPFKVAKINGRWSIPSKLNYPADAERQMAEAAASLMDLTKLGLASDSKSDHELMGVVDPTKADAGTNGLGTKVTIEDGSGNKLAEYIIGKEVKDSPDQRFVRLPGQDRVYRVQVRTNKLSTKFEDWIEKDLLKFSALDLRQILIDNYSIDEVNGRIVDGDKITLDYNETDSKWTMEGLAEGEELNTEAVNSLKTSLDDLKIVDVQRKPAGLSRELRAEEGIQIDAQAMMSLQSRGYYIVQGQLLSNEGEILCRLKDGIEYTLRFGEIATGTEEGKSDADGEPAADTPAPDPMDPNAPEKAKGSNRYLFVTASFNENLIAKPELEPLPGEGTPAGGDDEGSAPTEVAQAEPAAETAPEPPTEAAAPESPAAEPTTEATPEPTAAEPSVEPDSAAPVVDDSSPQDAQEAERQRIERDNKRKQADYDEKVKAGKEKVAKLNDRFADWYFVISDEMYKKIKLTRAELIKTVPGEGNTPADVDALQQDLQAPIEPATP